MHNALKVITINLYLIYVSTESIIGSSSRFYNSQDVKNNAGNKIHTVSTTTLEQCSRVIL